MHVVGRAEHGFAVEFDAEDPKAAQERYIFDHAILAAKQIEAWTGVNLDGEMSDE
jgi:hypothetical protein